MLSADYASSVQIVTKMLDGSLPGAPRLYFGVTDVRDVADLHVRAMTHPQAAGERFLAVAPGGAMSMKVRGQDLGSGLYRSMFPVLDHVKDIYTTAVSGHGSPIYAYCCGCLRSCSLSRQALRLA